MSARTDFKEQSAFTSWGGCRRAEPGSDRQEALRVSWGQNGVVQTLCRSL